MKVVIKNSEMVFTKYIPSMKQETPQRSLGAGYYVNAEGSQFFAGSGGVGTITTDIYLNNGDHLPFNINGKYKFTAGAYFFCNDDFFDNYDVSKIVEMGTGWDYTSELSEYNKDIETLSNAAKAAKYICVTRYTDCAENEQIKFYTCR